MALRNRELHATNDDDDINIAQDREEAANALIGMVKSLNDFINGCILMHCGMQVAI